MDGFSFAEPDEFLFGFFEEIPCTEDFQEIDSYEEPVSTSDVDIENVLTQPLEIKASKKTKVNDRSQIYGHGCESNRRRTRSCHYKQPYDDLQVYVLLKRPNKEYLIELGAKFNSKFRDGPIFGRDQKRSKEEAAWFFEDHKKIVSPWLKGLGIIN